MAEIVSQDPIVDDSNIEWEDAKTKNGQDYQIGRPKRSTETDGDEQQNGQAATVMADKAPFSINVDWKVGGTDWRDTAPELKWKAGLFAYALYFNRGDFYNYILYIKNTETYNYTFYDESVDSYNLNTFTTGDHYIKYNSPKPNIFMVQGS